MLPRPPSGSAKPPVRSRRWLPAAVLATAAALAGPAAGESLEGLTDQQVKVAFVYNFAKFVDWPAESFASPQAPVVLCTPPRSAAAALVPAIAGRKVQGRELRARRDVRSDELRGCHILFVAAGDERPVDVQLRDAAGLPLLTVGDAPGFAAAGGMIGFVMRDERVRFEINADAAQRAGLRISAQLMRLATIVPDAARGRP